MTFQVPNRYRLRTGNYGTTDKEGNNGAFLFKLDGKRITIIASDGLGWEHVSVSLDKKKCPNWNLMCKIKDIFWDEEDAVIQYHPRKQDYVNTCIYHVPDLA